MAVAAGQIPKVHLGMEWEILWMTKMRHCNMTHNLYSVS